jgi:hypothetical protein
MSAQPGLACAGANFVNQPRTFAGHCRRHLRRREPPLCARYDRREDRTDAEAGIIGLPSPLALGLIAGIGEFIPYVGPLLGASPRPSGGAYKSPQAA